MAMLLEPWTAILYSKKNAKQDSNTKRCTIATDGRYLYVHTEDGLIKFGTGMHGTVKSHIYGFKPNYYPNVPTSSLALVGDKLYFWTPHLPSPSMLLILVVHKQIVLMIMFLVLR